MTAPQERTDTGASLVARAVSRLDVAGPVLSASVAVALAALGMVALRPDPTPAELALFVGATGAVTVGLQFRYERSDGRLAGRLGAAAALFAVTVGGTWLLVRGLTLRQAALALLGVASLCSYGLYRYQLLALGTLEESDAPEQPAVGTDGEDSDGSGGEETEVSERDRLAGEVARLQAENERLREEFTRLRRTQHGQTAVALVAAGAFAAVGGLLLPGARTVLFSLAGTGVFLGVLTYYLTPGRFLPASVGRSVYEQLAGNHDRLVDELGLSEARYYVPLGEGTGVRLYAPQSAASPLPTGSALRELFVVEEEKRGLSLQPTGEALFAEFERAVADDVATAPGALAAQLGDALVEQFEVVESVERTVPAETSREAGEVTVGITGSAYGSLGQFDHPVVSFLAVGLARGLDTSVAVTVEEGESDRVDATVVCRWPADAE